MDEKLHKILNRINLDEKYFNLFYNAKILKNEVDELNNTITVEIYNENDISVEMYNELVNKFSNYFDDAIIYLKIVNNTSTSDFFEKNYNSIIDIKKYPILNEIDSNNMIEFYSNSLSLTTTYFPSSSPKITSYADFLDRTAGKYEKVDSDIKAAASDVLDVNG